MTDGLRRKNKELQMSNRFVLAEFFLCSVIVFMTVRNVPAVVSVCFSATFVLLVAYFIYMTHKPKQKLYLYYEVLYAMFVAFICVLINSFDQDQFLSFETLKNLLQYYSAVLFMFLMLNIKTSIKTMQLILWIHLVIGIIYPIAYYLKWEVANLHSGVGLTLNFSNPNLAGMWILQSVLYLCIGLITFKSKFVKLIYFVVLCLDFNLMMQTGARNCMIAFALFAVGCIWVFIKIRPKISKKLIFLVNIIPISFLFLYLKFIEIIEETGRLDFLISEGKSLTSRVNIWERNLKKIEDCWLIGSYYTAAGNTHNSHLVILGSFGVVTLVLSIWFMYKLCVILNDNCKAKKNLYPLIAFFAIIFMGIGEGALFSGAMGLYIMACGFIYLTRCDLSGIEPTNDLYQEE